MHSSNYKKNTKKFRRIIEISFGTQGTEVRKQSDSVNNAMDPITYQSINKQNDNEKSSSLQQAYIYTEIENRPPITEHDAHEIPYPPLQTDYPKSIQNHIESRIINRPLLTKYNSPSIPSSLPSIVHQPSNTVTTITNFPANFLSALNAQQQQQFIAKSLPVITSTYSNRESGNRREKVIVKVVKAPSWYLNDASERKSYYNAVAHGLLNDNGFVYVNNIEKETAAQLNASPNKLTPLNIASNQNLSTAKNTIPSSAVVQSQNGLGVGNPTQSYNRINYWPPCAAYAQSVQIPQLQPQHQTQPLSYLNQRSLVVEDAQYTGHSSYNNINPRSIDR